MIPKTFTFKVRPENSEKFSNRKNQNMEGDKMEMKATLKIRQKDLAKVGLKNPIKFYITPRMQVEFNIKGETEVPVDLGEKLLKQKNSLYELVKEESVIIPAPPIAEPAKPVKKAKLEPKTEPTPIESEQKDFIKQITE